MNKTLVMMIIGSTLLGLAGVASSHEMPYVQAQPGKTNAGNGVAFSLLDCGVGNHPVANLSMGGVCFGAGEESGWGGGSVCGFGDCEDLFGQPISSEDPRHLMNLTQVLTINDLVFDKVAGVYCQNLSPQTGNLCGGNLTGPPETEPGGNPSPICQATHREGANGCEFRSMPYVEFCDTITLRPGLDGPLPQGSRREGGDEPGTAGSGDWADPSLPNWDVDYPVMIFLSAPLNGNPLFENACTDETGGLGWATAGTVSHT